MKVGGSSWVADGFTIIEVMIVLAVSGILLISAIILINGRQARTEFTTGINIETQQLQQIINETASGYYPYDSGYSCAGSATGPVIFAHSPKAQGTNTGCIFLGKAIQFGMGSAVPDSGTLGVLPLVGNQYQSSGGVQAPVLTVADSVPRAAYPINAGENSVPTATVVTDPMEYGLRMASANNACGLSTTAVCYLPVSGGGLKATGMAAFVSGDSAGNIAATTTGSSTKLQSGSQQLSLYGVKSSAQNSSFYQASANIGSLARTTGLGNLDPAQEVMICIASGSTNQSGLFTIGGNGIAATGSGALSVSLKILNGTSC